MKALSLTQPWATLVVTGEKKIETRSWKPSRFGTIAIHASKGFPKRAIEICAEKYFHEALRRLNYSADNLMLGAIIGTVDVVGYLQSEIFKFEHELHRQLFEPYGIDFSEKEKAFGDYSENRYGWILKNPRRLVNPVPCKGSLSLWEVPKDIEAQFIFID
jgi:activating signal cointegrator 1